MCDLQGSSLKAVNVRTENGTEDTAHLNAFCIKDKGQKMHHNFTKSRCKFDFSKLFWEVYYGSVLLKSELKGDVNIVGINFSLMLLKRSV